MIAVASLAAAALTAGAPFTASTSLDPGQARFADRIAATATVLVDRSEVDPNEVRVVGAFDPLDVLTGPVIERRPRGARTEVTVHWDIACLDEDCVPGNGPRILRLPPLRVSAPRRNGTRVVSVVSWPAVTVTGRVTHGEAGAAVPPFRRETDLPRATYRLSPRLLAASLDGLAAALLLAGALLVLRQIVARRRHRAAERFARLSPLERALVYARESERRGPADRRRALGLLGRVLGGTGSGLGNAAFRLAWSAPDPSPEQVAAVVGDVERGGSP
jgi:hypothetical protein